MSTDRTADEVRAQMLVIIDEETRPWRAPTLEIDGSTRLSELNIDSADVIEMQIAAEVAFPGVQIEDDDFTIESTVDQVCDAVARRCGVLQ